MKMKTMAFRAFFFFVLFTKLSIAMHFSASYIFRARFVDYICVNINFFLMNWSVLSWFD